MAHADMIQNIYLFNTLDSTEIQQISKIASEKSLTAGETVFMRGDSSDALFVIRMGSIKIVGESKAGDELKIALMGSGSHFGEMGFLDGEKRSASANVVENSTLLQIKYSDLQAVLDKNDKIALKVYRALATYTCRRLRMTTEDLNYAREQNLKHF